MSKKITDSARGDFVGERGGFVLTLREMARGGFCGGSSCSRSPSEASILFLWPIKLILRTWQRERDKKNECPLQFGANLLNRFVTFVQSITAQKSHHLTTKFHSNTKSKWTCLLMTLPGFISSVDGIHIKSFNKM